VEFKPLILKPGEEVRLVIHVNALKAGDVRLRVEIRAKELTAGPLIEEESTTIAEELPG
jgi:predicted DNA-binding antitoxin AbrB/MazE fold protein